jgi:hypothetical protein
MKTFISSCAVALGLAMGLPACTDPYDPGRRAIGGGSFGAATGATIGGIAGGGRGAATGALIGGGPAGNSASGVPPEAAAKDTEHCHWTERRHSFQARPCARDPDPDLSA